MVEMLYDLYAGFGPASVAHLVRVLPSKLMQVLPEAANFQASCVVLLYLSVALLLPYLSQHLLELRRVKDWDLRPTHAIA